MSDDGNAKIVSPNSVLANSLLKTIDMLRPRVAMNRPKQIKFVVGTQINGYPHLGTALVQASAFSLARLARRAFSVDTSVTISALDNAPHDIVIDPETFHSYQQTYFHALGSRGITKMINDYYRNYLEALSDLTDAEYEIETYSQQQADPRFRAEFLESLHNIEQIRWWLSPSHGVVHLRLPCPQCGWAEKRAERTRIVELGNEFAVFSATCLEHGEYELSIDPVNGGYIDLATLYRNLIKERAYLHKPELVHVMVKGGDWAYGCQLVDGAHAHLGSAMSTGPLRIFTPMVLTDSGGKLSKSLIRESGLSSAGLPANPWVLNTTKWEAGISDFAASMEWLVELLLSDPKHFFRSYTTEEICRIMATRPDFTKNPRVRQIQIYKRYFDLIASGQKTVEVRVAYTSMKRIQAGQMLLFTCRGEKCLTRVKRIANYSSFDEMFSQEDPNTVNPHLSQEVQLDEIRKIFPPEKEKLGVIAIEVERIVSL